VFDVQKTIALGCLLLTANSHAADTTEPDNVVLNKGDQAAYSGVLVPPARAGRLLNLTIDLTTCQKVSGLKDEEAAVVSQRMSNLNAENTMLSDRLAKTKEDGFWGKVGMFVLGAATTTAIAYSVSKATK
jgi:hypothetical protein